MVEADNERELIFACQKGDQAAFEMLIRRHQRMIHSLTYRMTGSMADAEDLAQETFIQAWRQMDAFRAEAKFSSWLYRIAMNLSLNWRDREGRRGDVHQNWHEQEQTNGSNNSPIAHQVQEALMKLPAKQRAAVILTTYDGLNHADAARALNCSETTISWRLFAARAKLKKLLNSATIKKEENHE